MEKELNFNLAELFGFLKKKVISILLLGLGTTLLVIFLSFLSDDYYISSARLTVVADQSAPSGSAASFLGGFSGGGGIGGSQLYTKIKEVEEVITSRDFFRHLLTVNPGIFNDILYADSYNKDLQSIVYLQGAPAIEDIINKDKLFSVNENFFNAYSQFLQSFEFTKELKSDFFTISYTHISPVFANQMLELVISEANEIQKTIEINEANNALDYLLGEIGVATNAEVRGSMSKLVERQLKTKMIANMRENYSIKIIDSPFIPTKKSGPLRAIIAILTFIVSILLIIPLYVFLHSKELRKQII